VRKLYCIFVLGFPTKKRLFRRTTCRRCDQKTVVWRARMTRIWTRNCISLRKHIPSERKLNLKHTVDVSLVIVNWNTRDILRACLNSIYKETREIQFETIVVDNASNDGSASMIRTEFPHTIILENPGNRGFAAAANQGMRSAKGRYVLLLNPDSVILHNSVAKAIRFADDHPEAAVIGCRVLSLDRSVQQACFMFPSILNLCLSTTYLCKLFPHNKFFGREDMTWWHQTDVREVDVVRGCFMVVRQKAIEQVGALDEDFFMYGEETDWCYRFKKAGFKIMFTPTCEIIHIGGASTVHMQAGMRLQLEGSILLFMKNHKGRIQYTLACFLAAVFFLVRIPYWLGTALLSKKERGTHVHTAVAYTVAASKALSGWRALCINR